MSNSTESTSTTISKAIKIDELAVKGHVNEIVRSSVEETLNKLIRDTVFIELQNKPLTSIT